jgi:hypothetical protein
MQKGNMANKKLKHNDEDIAFLADCIGYYLSETIEDIRDWDCEHLAINLIRKLRIISPEWRKDKNAKANSKTN